ncbi:uncharacterized protein Triagg1_1662 [Trichoderma aggressivum f. europaeum]|uniref:Peptidase S8/S53 domain-containing protein n=1 Tax=Trichoderma aggressivum f. europaeum TaxID=173218 RepID=A0AAE1M8K8_9HYPO|nr:hypothetical protein Triagg1_1662 [Trichoderma aggressivum f. europaeum]
MNDFTNTEAELGEQIGNDDGLESDEDRHEDEAYEEDEGEEIEDYDDDEYKEINDYPIQTFLTDFQSKAIVPGKLDWKNPKIVEEIWTDNPNLSRPSDSDGKNILHLLVESYIIKRGPERKCICEAISHITARYPELVQNRSTSGPTPLYMAMVKGDQLLVTTIINKCKLQPNAKDDGNNSKDVTENATKGKKEMERRDDPLAQALAVQCKEDDREENPLHYALRTESSAITPAILNRIVRRAPVAAIAARDSDGFTPLHYAVDYGKSSRAQFELIMILLRKGEPKRLITQKQAVLDLLTNDSRLSVYQHLIKTREYFVERPTVILTQPIRQNPSSLNKVKTEGKPPEVRGAVQGQSTLDVREQEWVAKAEAMKDVSNTDKERSKPSIREEKTDEDVKGGNEGPSLPNSTQKKEGPGAAKHREQRTVVGPPGDSLTDDNGPTANSEIQRKHTLQQKPMQHGQTIEERKHERDDWSKKIEMELKKQYLRSRPHQRAIQLLYGKNPQDIQLCFDYECQRPELDALSFTESFDNVKFDEVLQYVAFSDVRIKNDHSNTDHKVRRRGRSDLEFFFRWLGEIKQVKCILKVIVRDNVEMPHSDEVIERALSPFNIEVLDWNKPDIDPLTIFNASNDLKELVLHWNGNNSVLRAWSEPQGLPKLQKLTMVDLIPDATLESKDRMNKNIDTFRNRLKEQFTNRYFIVKVQNGRNEMFGELSPSKGSSVNNLTRAPKILQHSHRWLNSTEEFAERIFNVWEKIVSERLRPSSVDATKKAVAVNPDIPEIIVAVIDDGIDTTQENLVGHILPGRTFGYEGDRVQPWHASESGHGSLMATMICSVCPMAKIYPIRLKTSNRDHKRTIDPQSAIDAINAAVDRGVDIISISWTVAKPKGDMLTAFNNAIRRAIAKPVLILCSSKDLGHADDTSYPAASRSDSLIKIGAAQPSGLPYSWAGAPEKLDFIFPGVEIAQQQFMSTQSVENSQTSEHNTGSSIATALGAGLASLIMYCTHIGCMFGSAGLTKNHVDNLHKYEFMVKAIRAFGCSSSKDTGGKFVEVWKKLDGCTSELKGASYEESCEKIAALAQDLINITSE